MPSIEENKINIKQLWSGGGKLIYPTKSIRAPIFADVIKIGCGVDYPDNQGEFYTGYGGAICNVKLYTSTFHWQKSVSTFKHRDTEGDFMIGDSQYHIVATVEGGTGLYNDGSGMGYTGGLIGPVYEYNTATYRPSVLFGYDRELKSKLRQLVLTLDRPVKLMQIGYTPFGYNLTRDAVQMLSVECYNKGTPVAVSGWFRVNDGCVSNGIPEFNIRMGTEFVFNGLGSYLTCPDNSVTCQMVKNPVQD